MNDMTSYKCHSCKLSAKGSIQPEVNVAKLRRKVDFLQSLLSPQVSACFLKQLLSPGLDCEVIKQIQSKIESQKESLPLTNNQRQSDLTKSGTQVIAFSSLKNYTADKYKKRVGD
jgi:hypothetical protein